MALIDNQLHFSHGYAINPDTTIGSALIKPNQRFYILSRKSTAHTFHDVYRRLMHGYYTIRRKDNITQSPMSTVMPVSTDHSISMDSPTNAPSHHSTSTSIVDMSAAFMYVESRAGSVRTNSLSNWPMTDSGYELTVFFSLDLFGRTSSTTHGNNNSEGRLLYYFGNQRHNSTTCSGPHGKISYSYTVASLVCTRM